MNSLRNRCPNLEVVVVIESILGQITGGQSLSREEMTTVVDQIMAGEWQDNQIALLLTALRAKGETVEEVVGAAESLRRHMTKIRSPHETFLDTCGTGGDGTGTFNISTAAAIVTAAAGVPVAKHGNRSVSSKSGSSDVLTTLGVNIEANVQQVERCLSEVGICFCFAPLMHKSMKNVAAVRHQLGVPTIFNMLGPLCNPAGAPHQVLGVGRPELRPVLSHALQRLGTTRSVIVCGEDGLDEVTIGSKSYVSIATPSGIEELEWTPEEFGLQRADKTSLVINGPDESAEMIREILSGKKGPPRDIVVINTATALWLTGFSDDLTKCADKAQQAIDTGAAKELLSKLAEYSHASAG